MTTVFIVDDDQSITLFLRLLLEGMGFQIIGTASNGQIAIDKIKILSEKPDILIMDYRMPIMDGIEATVEIRKLNVQILVIFTTADDEIREKALEVGAFDVVSKPFKFEELLNSINSTIDKKNKNEIIKYKIG